MDKIYTPKQLSEMLHVKLSTIYKWVHYGYIPYVKLGSLTRFKESRIDNWLKKRENRGRYSIRMKL